MSEPVNINEIITEMLGMLGVNFINYTVASQIVSCPEGYCPTPGVKIISKKANNYGDELDVIIEVGKENPRFFKFNYNMGSFGCEWEFCFVTEVFPKKVIAYQFD